MFLLWILLSVFSYVSGQGALKPFPALNNVLTQSLSHGGEALSSWGRSQGSKLVGDVVKSPKRKASQKDAPIPHPKDQQMVQNEVSEAPPPKTTFRSQGQKRDALREKKFVIPVVATYESPQPSVEISPKHQSRPLTDEIPSIRHQKNGQDETIEEIPTPQSSPKSANVPSSKEESKPAPQTSAPSQAEEPSVSEESKPAPQTSNTSSEGIPTSEESKPAPRTSSSSSQNQEVPPASTGPTPSNPSPQEEFRGAPPPPPPPPPGSFKSKPQKKSAPKPQDNTSAGPGDAPKAAPAFMDELKAKFKKKPPAATDQSSTPTDMPEAEAPPMTDAERMASTRGSIPQNVKPKIWGGRKNGMIGPDHPDYETWFKKDEARREAERSQPKTSTDKPIKSDASKRSKINEWLKKNKAQTGKPAGLGGLFADIQNKRKEKKDAAPENAPQQAGTKRKSSKGGLGHGVTDDVLKTVKLNKTERKVPETPKAEDKTAHGFKAHILKSHTLRSRKQETKQTTPVPQSKDNKTEDLKATPSGGTENASPNAAQTPGVFNTAKTPHESSPETKPAVFATPLQTSNIPQETPLPSTEDAQPSEPVARKLNFSFTTPKLTRDQLRKRAKERRRANTRTVPVSSNAAFTPPTQEKLGLFATPESAPTQTPFKLSKSNKRSPAKKFIGAHRPVKTPPQQIPDSLPVNEITLTRLRPVGTPSTQKAPLYFVAKSTPYTPPKSERVKAAQSSTSSTETGSFENGKVLPSKQSSFPVSSEPVMSPEKENTPQKSSTSATGPVKKFLHTLFGKKTAKAPVVNIPLKDMSSSTTSSSASDENAAPNNREPKRQNLKTVAQKRVMAFKRREGLSRHSDD